MEDKEKKIDRCRFCHFHLNGERHCVEAGWEDDKVKDVTEDVCEKCDRFKSRYIEYPITVTGIDIAPIEYKDTWHAKVGTLVAVRPCGKEFSKKTYLGFYLGDLPQQNTVRFNEEEGKLKVDVLTNPAMYVPELGRIIWGCGSWWKTIEKEEDLRKITDEDINSQWYVKLVRQLSEENK